MSIGKYFLFTSRKETYKYTWKEEEISETFKEFLWFIPLLISVNILAFSERSGLMFHYTDTIRRLFLQKPFTTSSDTEILFEDIVTIDDWWNFIENNFLDGVYFDESASDGKLCLLASNLFLGPPRIRQLKVSSDSCSIHPAFKRYFNDCFAEYSFLNEQQNGEFVYDAGSYTWGEFGFYRGGGYPVYLTNDKNSTREILQKLKDEHWIESRTRLVVVEFYLYNANADIFAAVKFVAELLPTGGVIASHTIRPFHLLQSSSAQGILMTFFEVVLTIQIVFSTIREIMQMKYQGCKYFKSVWHWISVSLILVFYILLAFALLRHFWALRIIKEFDEKPNEYLDMDHIMLLQYYMFNLFGICVFLTWIQIFKFISFNKTMVELSSTLRKCANDLLGFGVIFLIVFVAFAQFGYLLFGPTNREFRTMTDSVFTLMRTILGDFDYIQIERANRILGPIFFLAYIFFVFFVLLNMFLAIINDTYSEVKSEIVTDQFALWRFLKSVFRKFLSNITCSKLKWDKEESSKDAQNVVSTNEQLSSSSSRRRQMMVRRRDMVGTRLFEELPQDETGPRQRNQTPTNISPIRRQLNSFENRLRNIESLMDNFVVRVDRIIVKLDSMEARNSRRN